ncbi:hypothetical protein CDV36_011341 [Fusarium kuroshium]|uniref:Uncharacterized protein n=1 Tax=Fusarium kuroshium TaxID=2010991 RepID=A0A3M2RVY2_9HYPO|nr:hypothetical protein CDV36_011341 [Fusarium kuroshium]
MEESMATVGDDAPDMRGGGRRRCRLGRLQIEVDRSLGPGEGGTVWRGKCRGSAGCRVRKDRQAMPINMAKVPSASHVTAGESIAKLGKRHVRCFHRSWEGSLLLGEQQQEQQAYR